MRAVCAGMVLVLLAGCAAAPEPAGSPAPEGTALANCERELRRRAGGPVRIVKVDIFEEQRGIVRGVGPRVGLGSTSYDCFTNVRGDVANVISDRRFD